MNKKRTKAQQKVETQLYYVGVNDPIEIRRSVLEASRELLQFLQKYEKFKAVRNEKREAVALLRAQMKDIGAMVNDLKKILPNTSLRALERHERPKALEIHHEEKQEIIPEIKPVQKETKELSDIERLEAELAEIEGKLGKLS